MSTPRDRPMSTPRDPPMTALESGAALYARGEYFEAHEAWEELWLSLDGYPRIFVQGLIQVAAACHKAWAQRQPRGCVMLLESALEKLSPAPADFMGVRTAPLLAGANAMLAQARRWLQGELDGLPPEAAPPIELLRA
jgi:predicted metal-dependent hydrolase